MPTGRESGVTFSGSCRSAPLAWRLGPEGDSRKPLRCLVRPPKEPPLSGLAPAQLVGRAAGQVSCPAPPGPGTSCGALPGGDGARAAHCPSQAAPLAGRPRRGPPGPSAPTSKKGAAAACGDSLLCWGWGREAAAPQGGLGRGHRHHRLAPAASPLGWGSRPSRSALPRVGGASRVCGALGSCGPGRPRSPRPGPLRTGLWKRAGPEETPGAPSPPPRGRGPGPFPEGPSPSPACDPLLPPLALLLWVQRPRSEPWGLPHAPKPQSGSGVLLPLQRWAARGRCSPDLGSRTPWLGFRPTLGASSCILWAPSGNSSGARAEGRGTVSRGAGLGGRVGGGTGLGSGPGRHWETLVSPASQSGLAGEAHGTPQSRPPKRPQRRRRRRGPAPVTHRRAAARCSSHPPSASRST